MKKGFILFTALFLLSTFTAFAAVKAVKEGDVVKVTWTYENADAVSVGLVGDFQGWNLAGALPMTKDASGIWSITLDGNATSEYLYKLNVDGEWTEDPTAPGTFDDGFGGLNGKVVAADLLNATPVAGEVAGPRMGLAFATFTQVTAYSDFITKDVKDGKLDGIELDAVGVAAKSYWKFAGNFLPGNRLDIEIAAIDNGNLKLWKANTDGTGTAFITPADGLANFGNFLFNPATALAQKPYLGHFKYTLTTPWVKILQAYNYAKSTLRDETYIYTFVKEDNSGDGTVEISNPEAIDLGGITLNATVALSKRTGKYGSYSWLDMNFGKGLDATLNFEAMTNETHIFNFFNDAKYLVGGAFAGKFGDLSLTTEGGYNLYSKDTGVKSLDALFAGAKVKYTMGESSLSAKFTYAGDSIDNLYGNDDQLNKGKILAEIEPAFKFDALDLSLTMSAKLDNMTSEIAAGKKPGMENYFKPSVGYTMGDIYFGLFTKLNYNLIEEATDATQPFAFKFGEVDAKISIANLGPGKLTSQIAFVNNTGDFKTGAFQNKGYDISIVNQYDMADQLTFYVSGIYRATGADETEADYKKESVMGASIGVNKVLIDQVLKNPQLFFLFDYNMNPWSGDYKTNLDQEDGNYRWDSLDAGKGKASARLGVCWSF